MRKMRKIVIGVSVAAFIAGIFMTGEAVASVRVKATLDTPNLRITIGNTPTVYHNGYGRKPLPVRRTRNVSLYRQDWNVAARLGRYTGVPAKRLIRFRRMGYSWMEIGRWLELPRPVVRAAMHEASWHRLIAMERQMAARNNGMRHKKGRKNHHRGY